MIMREKRICNGCIPSSSNSLAATFMTAPKNCATATRTTARFSFQKLPKLAVILLHLCA